MEDKWHSSGIGLAIDWLRGCQVAAEWQSSDTSVVVKWHLIGSQVEVKWQSSGIGFQLSGSQVTLQLLSSGIGLAVKWK